MVYNIVISEKIGKNVTMKIIISSHAKQRMSDRKISQEMLCGALLRPDEIGQDKNYEKRLIAKKICLQKLNTIHKTIFCL